MKQVIKYRTQTQRFGCMVYNFFFPGFELKVNTIINNFLGDKHSWMEMGCNFIFGLCICNLQVITLFKLKKLIAINPNTNNDAIKYE